MSYIIVLVNEIDGDRDEEESVTADIVLTASAVSTDLRWS